MKSTYGNSADKECAVMNKPRALFVLQMAASTGQSALPVRKFLTPPPLFALNTRTRGVRYYKNCLRSQR